MTHQPGHFPGDLPALVHHLLAAGLAVLTGHVVALLLVHLPGLAVAGGFVHRAALTPGLLVGDLGALLLRDLGTSSSPAVSVLRCLPFLSVTQIIFI